MPSPEHTDSDSPSSALVAMAARTDLEIHGDVSLGLFALEMYFGIDDIGTTAAEAVTDGPGDRKCDLIYVDREARTAVIAQVYAAADPGLREAPANKASDLNTAAAWVLGAEIPTGLPSTLKSAILELRNSLESGEIDSVFLWYVHNLCASANVKAELDKVAGTANALIANGVLGSDVSVRTLEVDRTQLDAWYASTQSSIQVADELDVPTSDWTDVSGASWEAVSTTVPASWLQELVKKYGDELYSANIRGYMPSRRSARNINYNIEKTAKEDGENFWAYNNGVTALVHSITAGDSLKVSGIAIVNGAQTTGAIARTGLELSDAAKVPIRFVACSDQELIERIIRYNNSQNPIKASDFRSMDGQQERLREEFSAIPDAAYLGARRGGSADRARRPSNLVSSDTAAQALACVGGEPGVAYHELRTIWEKDDVYVRFFNDRTTAETIVFAFSLMKAVQARKTALSSMSDAEMTASYRIQLAFLRKRGATYLATAAIARCLETFVGTPVPDRLSLRFTSQTSPAQGEEIWLPIVKSTLAFASKLDPAAESGALRRRETVKQSMSDFAEMVEATRAANAAIYEAFSDNVSTTT